jgi:hypothetical protein
VACTCVSCADFVLLRVLCTFLHVLFRSAQVTHSHFFLQKDNLIKQLEGWCTDGVTKGAHLATLKAQVAEMKVRFCSLPRPS